VDPQRVYHYGNLASHLIGYLGEISHKETMESVMVLDVPLKVNTEVGGSLDKG
ncbi:MAG: hypothetical protein D3919_15675, partial [Candidatus Electrothrix sp. AW5]|nr:hypothetical protein [Candidatus Electrothrix gigas]